MEGLLREAKELPEDGVDFVEAPKVFVGFSKGIVVLNQLILAMKLAADGADTLTDFCKTVRRIVFLDGGHNGRRADVYLADPAVLEFLVRSGVAVDVRVSPYQVRDEKRPWIGKEERKFSRGLKSRGCSVTRMLITSHEEKDLFQLEENGPIYVGEEDKEIDVHFSVIDSLKEADFH